MLNGYESNSLAAPLVQPMTYDLYIKLGTALKEIEEGKQLEEQYKLDLAVEVSKNGHLNFASLTDEDHFRNVYRAIDSSVQYPLYKALQEYIRCIWSGNLDMWDMKRTLYDTLEEYVKKYPKDSEQEQNLINELEEYKIELNYILTIMTHISCFELASYHFICEAMAGIVSNKDNEVMNAIIGDSFLPVFEEIKRQKNINEVADIRTVFNILSQIHETLLEENQKVCDAILTKEIQAINGTM